MDIEIEAPLDELEALVADESDETIGDGAPTATCSVVATCCS